MKNNGRDRQYKLEFLADTIDTLNDRCESLSESVGDYQARVDENPEGNYWEKVELERAKARLEACTLLIEDLEKLIK